MDGLGGGRAHSIHPPLHKQPTYPNPPQLTHPPTHPPTHQVSTNLARDMGVQEVVVGAAYMLGPTLGGFLFTGLGFRRMFLILSLPPLGMALILFLLLKPLGIGGRKGGGGGRKRREEQTATVRRVEEDGLPPPPPPPTQQWWKDPTILLVSLALIADAAALGFLDPTLAHHLLLLLDLHVDQIGLLFALPPLLYSTAALGVYPIADRIGRWVGG